MNLGNFLKIIEAVKKYAPIGVSLVEAVKAIIPVVGPVQNEEGKTLTEEEVHAAVAGARTVWERIEIATRTTTPGS